MLMGCGVGVGVRVGVRLGALVGVAMKARDGTGVGEGVAVGRARVAPPASGGSPTKLRYMQADKRAGRIKNRNQ
jgi:hypothetical protein